MKGQGAALARPRIALPYLHEIPRGEEASFRQWVTALAEHHTFISYSEAIRRVVDGPIDRPYLAFSFDDGFASNVWAAGVLEEFGTTGCFFVPPGFIDSSLPISEAMRKFGFARGTHEESMTWDDLELLKERGHEIGNHTTNHLTLAEQTDAQLVDEIAGGAERIRQVLGSCTHFAWPRGRFEHFSAFAARTVFESGHISCASAVRGAHVAQLSGNPRALCVRRDHIRTSWPLRHQLYFLARSSRVANPATNDWPPEWADHN